MYCFSQFCRLCVRTDRNLVNLFCIDNDMLMFSEKIRCLMPEIVYEEDTIPNMICKDCCNNLKMMYDFRQMCLRNTRILRLYASKLLNVNETADSSQVGKDVESFLKKNAKENFDVDFSLIFVKQESNVEHYRNDENNREKISRMTDMNEDNTIMHAVLQNYHLSNIDNNLQSVKIEPEVVETKEQENGTELIIKSEEYDCEEQNESLVSDNEDQCSTSKMENYDSVSVKSVSSKKSENSTKLKSRKSVIEPDIYKDKGIINLSVHSEELTLKLECTEEDNESCISEA